MIVPCCSLDCIWDTACSWRSPIWKRYWNRMEYRGGSDNQGDLRTCPMRRGWRRQLQRNLKGTMRTAQQGNSLTIGVVQFPSLDVLETWLDKTWINLVWSYSLPCFEQKAGLTRDLLRCLPTWLFWEPALQIRLKYIVRRIICTTGTLIVRDTKRLVTGLKNIPLFTGQCE